MHLFIIGATVAGLLMLATALSIVSFIEGYDLRTITVKDTTEGSKIHNTGTNEYVRGTIYAASALFLIIAAIVLVVEIFRMGKTQSFVAVETSPYNSEYASNFVKRQNERSDRFANTLNAYYLPE